MKVVLKLVWNRSVRASTVGTNPQIQTEVLAVPQPHHQGMTALPGVTSQMLSHDHEKNFYGESQASLILEGLDFDSGRTSDRCGSVKNHNFEDEPPPPKRMSRCSVRGNELNLTPPGHFSFSNTSRSRFVGSAFWGLIGTKVGPPIS